MDEPELVREHDRLDSVEQSELREDTAMWVFTVASATKSRSAISAFE